MVNPITYPGGGGFLVWTIRLSTTTLKRLYLAPPNLVTLFLSIRHILEEFLQNRFTRGVAAVVSEMISLEKLSIQSSLFRFKTIEMQRGYTFISEKMFSGIVIFVEFCFNAGGKYRIAMTRSIVERNYLWRHISKSKKAINLKFCLLTCIIHTIISGKLQINPLIVTLFSSSGPNSPPPPEADEMSKCRRL